jgi:very-short-patch-repair endonuclease
MPTRKQIEIIKWAARDLRKRQTPSEDKFWQAVRNRRLLGKKFYRQHPLRFKRDGRECFFIADFYCPECRLAVEIDGKIHERQLQKERDELRTWLINQKIIRVLRLKNEELDNDLPGALAKVAKELNSPPQPLGE